MGEITATLKGNIRIPNSLDFVEIFCSVAGLDKKCSSLAEYICELTLLQAEMGQYSPAEIAASCVLLARLLMKLGMSLFHYSFITCNLNVPVFGVLIRFFIQIQKKKKCVLSINLIKMCGTCTCVSHAFQADQFFDVIFILFRRDAMAWQNGEF